MFTGIDPRVWRQAQEDNPDPVNMIPQAIVGLDALRARQEWQQVFNAKLFFN